MRMQNNIKANIPKQKRKDAEQGKICCTHNCWAQKKLGAIEWKREEGIEKGGERDRDWGVKLYKFFKHTLSNVYHTHLIYAIFSLDMQISPIRRNGNG